MSLHYLIDGYNMLYALPELPPGTLETKRNRLLELLDKQKPNGKNQITVIFDSREGTGDRSKRGTIQIVYTSGETADDWIGRHVREIPNPRVCVVVTNDQGLRRLIRGTGAKGVSVEEFLERNKETPAKRSEQRTEMDAESITDEMKKKWL